MVFPIGSALSIAAPIIGGLLGRKKQKETPIQRHQRSTIDQILQGVQGQGPLAGLFQGDEEAFDKSYVQPALSMFQNQIAPQIQQSYIAEGQQRGSGLEDTLARAGVDLEQMLAQQYGQFQQGAQNRAIQALGGTLGAGPGFQGQGERSPFIESLAGTLGTPGFQDELTSILKYFSGQQGDSSQQGVSSGVGNQFGTAALLSRRGFTQ